MQCDGLAARARAAMAEMRELFPATPLLRNDYLSQKHGADIWLKREDLSPVRSYKIRGAMTAMRRAVAAGAGTLSVRAPETTRRGWPTPAATSASAEPSTCR